MAKITCIDCGKEFEAPIGDRCSKCHRAYYCKKDYTDPELINICIQANGPYAEEYAACYRCKYHKGYGKNDITYECTLHNKTIDNALFVIGCKDFEWDGYPIQDKLYDILPSKSVLKKILKGKISTKYPFEDYNQIVGPHYDREFFLDKNKFPKFLDNIRNLEKLKRKAELISKNLPFRIHVNNDLMRVRRGKFAIYPFGSIKEGGPQSGRIIVHPDSTGFEKDSFNRKFCIFDISDATRILDEFSELYNKKKIVIEWGRKS